MVPHGNIVTPPDALEKVKEALTKAGYHARVRGNWHGAANYIKLTAAGNTDGAPRRSPRRARRRANTSTQISILTNRNPGGCRRKLNLCSKMLLLKRPQTKSWAVLP